MTHEDLIDRAKAGEDVYKLTETMTHAQLRTACIYLIGRAVKDEIEMEKLIEHIELNNKELDKLINHE